MHERIIIDGGQSLHGELTISGAKNAALPCLFASLLSDEPLRLANLPATTDTGAVFEILRSLGCAVTEDDNGTIVTPQPERAAWEVDVEQARLIRASILALGPLLARFGKAVVPLPGGCDFGHRPIDIHLRGLEALGAKVTMHGRVIHAEAEKLIGTDMVLDYPTFTGTENLLMAAVLAEGHTMIDNAAREPEVADLARMLCKMGAIISGIGSSCLQIEGVAQLNGTDHSIIGDRIEAGTYLAAGVATRGEITVRGINPDMLHIPLQKLSDAGAELDFKTDAIGIKMAKQARAMDITTAPYPGFPTDLQAQFLAVNSLAAGTGNVTDQVWRQRFRTAEELVLLGAQISVHGNCATSQGVDRLMGTHVQATDLRASAALVIGGLAAQGTSVIHGAHHLLRGYEALPDKITALGGKARYD